MAGYDAHYASTRKDKPMLPVPCLHSSHQRQQTAVSSLRKQASAEGKGGKNTHHSAHQTPGSAFLNPCLRFSPCPARLPACYPPPPPLRLIHPLLATLGHESRLCMTARNIPCHKCFPKASTFVTLSADKTSPQPLMECASHFSECVNNFWLAGQTLRPGDVGRVCVPLCVSVSVFAFAYICLNIFTSLCFFSVFFLHKAGEKGPCHSCTS